MDSLDAIQLQKVQIANASEIAAKAFEADPVFWVYAEIQAAQEIGFVAIDSGALRNSRLIEGIGDFIRFLLIGQLQNPYATISVNVLSAAQTDRLGGRQASNLQ